MQLADIPSALLKRFYHFTEQPWLGHLAVLLVVSLLAYFPALAVSRLFRKYKEAARVRRHRSFQIIIEILDASIWPLLAISLYSAFGFWARLVPKLGGNPFRILPVLFAFLLYRILIAFFKEILPPGSTRRRIRKIVIPFLFVLVALQQLGALAPILSWLAKPLVSIGNYRLSAFSILFSIALLVLFIFFSRLVAFFLRTRLLPGLGVERTVSGSLATLSQYIIVAVGIVVALNSLGFNLSTLQIIFGAFGVGIGFGLQNTVNNFASGLIILIERKVKQGDIVTAGGTDGRVVAIGLRSSVIRTRAGHEIIVPNSQLVTNPVTNFSYHDRLVRVDLPVGVSYASDPNQIRDILLQAAKENERVLSYPSPDVLFIQYGNSSIDFELRIWIDDPWELPRVRSALYFSIWYKLKEAGIEIPFPQRDLHVRSGELKISSPPIPAREEVEK